MANQINCQNLIQIKFLDVSSKNVESFNLIWNRIVLDLTTYNYCKFIVPVNVFPFEEFLSTLCNACNKMYIIIIYSTG